jgi:hypothetical protein
VFNAALNFRLKWEGDLRTPEGQIEESGQTPDHGVERGGGVTKMRRLMSPVSFRP